MSKRPYAIIGSPRPKVDAYDKVTGRAVYADDIMLPRMLYGRILRSPHAHARILSIDTSAAEKAPNSAEPRVRATTAVEIAETTDTPVRRTKRSHAEDATLFGW